MKKQLLAAAMLLLCLALAACGLGDAGTAANGAGASGGGSSSTGSAAQTGGSPSPSTGENSPGEIFLLVNNQSFKVILYDNDAARALLALLPLRMEMDDLYGNEKYYYLPEDLPASPEAVGSIKTGDIMLYGPDCLVLFYDSFSTPYSYTRLGYIENAGEFAALLTSEKTTVELALAGG